MECGQCYPSQPFVVLTVNQFVWHGGGPLERQRQDSHVYRKSGTLPLIFRKHFFRDPRDKNRINPHTTHNSSNRSDEGLTLETLRLR